QKMAGYKIVDMHRLSGLLRIDGGRVVLGSRRERTDRKRAHVAERGRDLIGKSHPEEIQIFIGANVLQRDYGQGLRSGGCACRGTRLEVPECECRCEQEN